jgi:hypothetical protein
MLNAVYQWCFSEVQPNPKSEKGLFLNSVDKGVDHEQSSKLLPSHTEIATSVLNGNFDFQYHFRGEAKEDYKYVVEEDPNWSIEVEAEARNNYHGRKRFYNGRSKRKLYSHLKRPYVSPTHATTRKQVKQQSEQLMVDAGVLHHTRHKYRSKARHEQFRQKYFF